MDETPLPPEMADLTPALALHLRDHPGALETWCSQRKLPRNFLGILGRLAFDAEIARDEAQAAAASLTRASRRRRDHEAMRLFAQGGRGLPRRARTALSHCVEEGRTIDETARLMGIAPATVRTYLRRMRNLMKRNAQARLDAQLAARPTRLS
jgi:DNA-directed RNA polymerase specialized sigma24 family protein